MTQNKNEFAKNFSDIINLYQDVIAEIASKDEFEIDPFNFSKIGTDLMFKIWQNPEKIMNIQVDYMHDYLSFLSHIQSKYETSSDEELYKANSRDNRFKDSEWDSNIYYNFFKQYYLMNSEYLKRFANDLCKDKKTKFFIKQFTDASSPSNFVLTNPVVMREANETNFENLVRGFSKLLDDVKKSKKFLEISTANHDAFTLGENIATTKGSVIYQNSIMQLIKYQNKSNKTYSKPLLFVPAWINKYYILDLSPENSFVKWLVEQGFTVYMISWINPSKDHKDKNLEDYMQEGILDSIDFIENNSNFTGINLIGYCLGGTLVALTLAYMAKIKDKRIESATFLTTLLDFNEIGDTSIFTDSERIEIIEKRMEKEGYLPKEEMSLNFNMLRANDMIWSFFVNNYLLGKDIKEFDILYWNSDSTRIPAKMHSFCMRNMYQKNLLIEKNKITLKDVKIDLSKIDTDCYFLSTKDDHIAPWNSTYATLSKFKNKKFTLTASGHVAGVINHPDLKKYSYWTNDDLDLKQDKWFEYAKEHDGSWWNDWICWIGKHSGRKVNNIKSNFKEIEPAPGSYVKIK